MALRGHVLGLGRNVFSAVQAGSQYGIGAAPCLAGHVDAGVRGACHAVTSATKALRAGARSARSAVAAGESQADDSLSRATGIELKWCRSILRAGASVSLVGTSRAIRRYAQCWLHPDYDSHLVVFSAINAAIDAGGGWAHRLLYGHSLEWLPDLISKHGLITLLAYPIHLAQDFTTAHGIPLIPWAGCAYEFLVARGVAPATALGLLSVNLGDVLVAAGTLAAFAVIANIAWEAYRQGRNEAGEVACCGA
jgi:hypothetical protein